MTGNRTAAILVGLASMFLELGGAAVKVMHGREKSVEEIIAAAESRLKTARFGHEDMKRVAERFQAGLMNAVIFGRSATSSYKIAAAALPLSAFLYSTASAWARGLHSLDPAWPYSSAGYRGEKHEPPGQAVKSGLFSDESGLQGRPTGKRLVTFDPQRTAASE